MNQVLATICPTGREAIRQTVVRSKLSHQAIAAELGWTPSRLSQSISSGPRHPSFPCDEEHLVKLMQITGDYSILFTMADLLGFEVVPKDERLPDGDGFANFEGSRTRVTGTASESVIP